MKEDSKGSQRSESDNYLASIEEDDIVIESSPPIDSDLPEPMDPGGDARRSGAEAKKAKSLEAWKGRYSKDGES